ncbi:MAG: DsbA family protein [Alphaproteobacteria bacterium]|nr:DsbA family protein [Alphaproteobacteria bacterium]
MRASAGIILAAIIGIGGGAVGYWFFNGGSSNAQSAGTLAANATPAGTTAVATQQTAAATQVAQGLMPELKPDDMVLGSPDAKVTIVEYASLTCPHCARFHKDTLPQIKKEFIDTGKVKLVYRDFPFDEASFRAAMVARCAGKEKFYGFIDALFSTQDSWTREADWKAALARIAKLGGMSQETFDKCLADKSVEEPILAKRLEASQKLGVDSTPTFFINGEKVGGAYPFDHFATVIKRKLPAG